MKRPQYTCLSLWLLALAGCAAGENLTNDPSLLSSGGKGKGGTGAASGGASSSSGGVQSSGGQGSPGAGATAKASSVTTGGSTGVATTAKGGSVGIGGNRTTAAPSCTDKLKNGDETDIDCGGSCETKCAFGKKCVADTDCGVGTCASNICTTCANQTQDGDEADVDCGGSCTTKCAEAQKCTKRADCATFNCDTTTNTCGAQTNCLASIPTECNCSAQATAGVINPGGDITYCEAYVTCFLENDCKPTDTCATSNEGVCGVNKIGGGSSPGKGAAKVYTCACGT